jgi:hypothetical protein
MTDEQFSDARFAAALGDLPQAGRGVNGCGPGT